MSGGYQRARVDDISDHRPIAGDRVATSRGGGGVNVLLVSVDSLTRKFLTPYGEPTPPVDARTPNLDRFAERAAVFESHYAGSLPCMPARREWLTGTQEFLWRPWGPIEPFDDPLPRVLRRNGTHAALVTDHFHYVQHGSGGYLEDYNAFELVRGHEYDAWRSSPRDPDPDLLSQLVREAPGEPGEGGDFNLDEYTAGTDPRDLRYMNRAQYARNVADFEAETDFFAPKVFSRAAEWLRTTEWDDWFLYVDSFDVHEPFHVPEPYASMYTDEDPRDPDLTVWPYYGHVDEGRSELTDRELEFVRAQFAGNLTMVDEWFGRLLDALETRGLWSDTLVIVTTDHGHYLGEHGWVGKPTSAPLYDTLAHTPLLVWDPEGERNGERVDALTSAVDLYATVLDAADVPGADRDDRHSRSLRPLLRGEVDTHRDWALYGYWGSSVNVTDGTHTYLHPCDPEVDAAVHSTTQMDAYGWFTPPEPKDAEVGSVPYADRPVWRFEAPSHARQDDPMLFDVGADPGQRTDLAADRSEAVERMRGLLEAVLGELDAPAGQYERLALDGRRG
jgi:arylsulfatase A-like enzyme